MKNLLILFILLFSSMAHAQYPIETVGYDVHGYGNFAIEFGARMVMVHDGRQHHKLQVDYGMHVGVSEFADIGLEMDYQISFVDAYDSILNVPTLFGHFKLFETLTPYKGMALRLEYVPNWNESGHIVNGILVNTINIEDHHLNIHIGSGADNIKNDLSGILLTSVSLVSHVPNRFSQFGVELGYEGNLSNDEHTLSGLLAIVLGHDDDLHHVSFGVGLDYELPDIISWYVAVGFEYDFE